MDNQSVCDCMRSWDWVTHRQVPSPHTHETRPLMDTPLGRAIRYTLGKPRDFLGGPHCGTRSIWTVGLPYLSTPWLITDFVGAGAGTFIVGLSGWLSDSSTGTCKEVPEEYQDREKLV